MMRFVIEFKELKFAWIVLNIVAVTMIVQHCHGQSQYTGLSSRLSKNQTTDKRPTIKYSSKTSKTNGSRTPELSVTSPRKKTAHNNDAVPICKSTLSLTKSQAKMCKLYKDYAPFIDLGTKITVDECQYQLRNSHWNCSTDLGVQPIFGPILQTGVRESAFLRALSSASIVYTIARACRDGRLVDCGCSKAKKPKVVKSNWNWGGCGDNIDYAYKFSEYFVDSEKTVPKIKRSKSFNESYSQTTKAKLDRKTLMNMHNSRAGRRAVLKKTKIICKCHGVSDSCSLVTCWQQLPSFRVIGDLIKTRYDIASEVKISKQDGRIQVRNKRQNAQITGPTIDDLIYIEQSPDFCNRIDKLKHPGTSGRFCNASEAASPSAMNSIHHSSDESCHKMCCSRGYRTVRVINTFKCNCKFRYCCNTECQSCYKAEMRNVCK